MISTCLKLTMLINTLELISISYYLFLTKKSKAIFLTLKKPSRHGVIRFRFNMEKIQHFYNYFQLSGITFEKIKIITGVFQFLK